MPKSTEILLLTYVGARLHSQTVQGKTFLCYLRSVDEDTCSWGNVEPKRNTLARGKYLSTLF